MRVFELLLLFTRATPQQGWEFHLKTIYELAKYFFAYDMLSYAIMTPVYVSQMYDLKDSENDTENFVDSGYFSVNKTLVPFTSIGAYHAIEHEKPSMKVLVRIKGIVNDANNLYKYFIIAPEVNKIIQDFHNIFQIDDQNSKWDENHELTVSKNQRITLYVEKLDTTFKTKNKTLTIPNVSAILSRKKFEIQIDHRVSKAWNYGRVTFGKLYKKRFDGEKSIWHPITSNVKAATVKIKDQLVQVKEKQTNFKIPYCM